MCPYLLWFALPSLFCPDIIDSLCLEALSHESIIIAALLVARHFLRASDSDTQITDTNVDKQTAAVAVISIYKDVHKGEPQVP